ncbi:MAG TPA: GGDEF domain-containing protein [Devosia sp.]|nr:GGDEF domain-containing protein [Devosia sp.]
MRLPRIDLSPQSWGRVILTTIVGTVFCVVIALSVDSFNLSGMEDGARLRSILIDIFLPVLLAVPLLLFFTSKLRDLAIAHQRLTIYASTDALTGVLNRAAFSTLVDAYLKEVRTGGESRGAMLVIDADNFKAINDSYGHDRGDEALRMIASGIKATVRSPDLVGRLGGEEFGVFLPGAELAYVTSIAERIRKTVYDTDFTPGQARHRLTVSVGGAAFDHPIAFHDLFRLADQELYAAKQAGRNRVAIAPVRNYESLPMVAA